MKDLFFNISTTANTHLLNILQEGECLLIDVTPGGCNGFSYKYEIVQKNPKLEENSYTADCVLITQQAKEMLNGAQLEYEADEFGTSFFSISNPNATSKCGCGNSFSTFT